MACSLPQNNLRTAVSPYKASSAQLESQRRQHGVDVSDIYAEVGDV